jgi:phage tail sheath protein FI
MAETLISPGVLARENDQSQVSSLPIQAGAAIIGPTVKGPVEIPTLVSSYNDYTNRFGTTFISGGEQYTYFTSIAAYNYFNNGGTSLLVSRVVAGGGSTYTPATSSDITNNQSVTAGKFATASFALAAAFSDGDEVRVTGSFGLYRFVASATPVPADDTDGLLYFFSTGSSVGQSLANLTASMGQATALGGTLTFVSESGVGLAISSSASGSTYNGVIFSTGSASSFADQATLGGGVNGDSAVALVLETLSEGTIMNSTSSLDSNGALASGSSDNIRWQIVTSNTSSGTFDLVIRRGDDNANETNVLETWTNLSLDPTVPNFVSKVIGNYKLALSADNSQIEISGSYPNASRYVRVKSVNATTPNYFDNSGAPKSAYTASLPVVASGSFGNATGNMEANAGNKYYNNIISGVTNSQGLTGSDYAAMITLLANQDAYQYNMIAAPGLFDTANVTSAGMVSQVTSLISNAQNRGDHILILDQNLYGSTVANATTAAATRNTSYAATYWPWLQTNDPDTGENVWVPASAMIPGVYAQNDSVSYAWFAPAGINRGGLSNVTRAEKTLTQANRDTLYTGKVNPIATFPGTGVVVYGQKTLQTRATALDRVNVRRLLIELKSFISQVANNLVFEQNTIATRNRFLAQVNPYLEQVQQQQGLYAFRVIMDDTNNTADVIDRNQLIGQIFIQPTKTAEFIYLDFNILPTGATFPA